MDYTIKVRMPGSLLLQAERAATSLGMTADEYLRLALEEKVGR
jgi:hypothetical protein